MCLKKYVVGASAVMMIFANNPQVSADEVEIFGGEFENTNTQTQQNRSEVKTEQPAPNNTPIQNNSGENQPPASRAEEFNPTDDAPVEVPKVEEPVQTQPVETPKIEEPVQTQPVETPKIEEPVQTQPVETPKIKEPVQTQPVETPRVEEPVVTQPVETPRIEEPVQTQPVETPKIEEPVQTQPVETPRVEEPVQTQPVQVQPVNSEDEKIVEKPFTENNSNEEENFGDSLNFNTIDNQGNTEVFVPDEPADNNRNNTITVITPRSENNSSSQNDNSNKTAVKSNSLKKLPQRFVEVAADENYIYYLDKQSVSWKKIPYMNSEYMADVWIRMIERNPNTNDLPADLADYVNDPNTDELATAKAKGYQYMPADTKVLSHKKYFLEHYYLRPQRDQVQFLCELEVVGHPQNTASQRKYDPNNWEELIPGSIESVLYYSIIQIIGKGKASAQGHMTFADIFEEYARISIR